MRRGLGLLVVAGTLLAVLVACGSQQDADIPTANGSRAADPSGSVSAEDRARKFAQCMREHGIDMKDPDGDHPAAIGGQNGAPDDKTKAALEACRAYMPGGGDLTRPDAQQMELERRIAQCMREHGLTDYPDPDPNAGGAALNIDPNDAKFKAADEACKHLRPTGGPGGGGPAGGPGR